MWRTDVFVHMSTEDINTVSFKDKLNATPRESSRKMHAFSPTLQQCIMQSHVSVSVVNVKVTVHHYCT